VKLPEPFTYFVDRSLGRSVIVEMLRAAAEQTIAHDDRFAQDTVLATCSIVRESGCAAVVVMETAEHRDGPNRSHDRRRSRHRLLLSERLIRPGRVVIMDVLINTTAVDRS
jgi:hypothetical protein